VGAKSRQHIRKQCAGVYLRQLTHSSDIRKLATMASGSSETLLTTHEAAELIRLSPRTLEGMRYSGDGPPYLKLGSNRKSRVLYEKTAIKKWLNAVPASG